MTRPRIARAAYTRKPERSKYAADSRCERLRKVSCSSVVAPRVTEEWNRSSRWAIRCSLSYSTVNKCSRASASPAFNPFDDIANGPRGVAKSLLLLKSKFEPTKATSQVPGEEDRGNSAVQQGRAAAATRSAVSGCEQRREEGLRAWRHVVHQRPEQII